MKKIPFSNISQQYLSLKDEIDKKVLEIFNRSDFILGEDLKDFEQEFASYTGSKYAAGVSSGTDALIIAMKALGIKDGDEVITAANSFIATAEAISLAGARPVFADINEDDFNISVKSIEKVITDRTRAIIPVHLYGQPADMGGVMDLAAKYGLNIIEDACQAHGAEYKNKKAGSIGQIGCFSFYPSKNLGAFGDGGAVITSSEDLYQKMILLRSHGEITKNRHLLISGNNRLDNLQAAILGIKLQKLDYWNAKLRKNAELYRKHLEGLDLILPEEINGRKHIYHMFVIRVHNRNGVIAGLGQNGISTGIHYPVPVPLQPAYKSLGYLEGDFPAAETISKQIISLPIYPELSEDEIIYVANTLRNILNK